MDQPDKPFQFLDLPDELQLNVIVKHYEGSYLSLGMNREDSFVCKTFSSLKIEGTSKHVQALCIKTRNDKITKRLLVEQSCDVKDLVRQIVGQAKFEWIRNHVTSIDFSGRPSSSVKPDWQSLITSMPKLKGIRYVSAVTTRSEIDSEEFIMNLFVRNTKLIARMLRAGRFDSWTWSLTNYAEARNLCKSLDDNVKGHGIVTTSEIVRVLTLEGKILFHMVGGCVR